MNAPATSQRSSDILARLAPFETARISHPRYAEAFSRARQLACRGQNARIVIVTGPAGVGKSTLAGSLHKKMSEDYANGDASLVPSVMVKAVAPHNQAFSWKDFYIRVLMQLREPLIEQRHWVPEQHTLFGSAVPGPNGGDRLVTEQLRRITENAMHHRRTRLLIIDEAHHMLMCRSTQHLEFPFESLKSLAEMSNAAIVLVGTYSLLSILEHSAQLIRRSQFVHFPRYLADSVADCIAFKSVFERLRQHLAVPFDAALAEDVSFLFLKTAGCVGILRDLLREAQYMALETGRPSIKREVIDEVCQSNTAIRTILREAAFGETMLQDIPIEDIEALVQMAPADILAACAKEQELQTVSPRASTARQAPRLPPGTRLPKRDPVGGAGRVHIRP